MNALMSRAGMAGLSGALVVCCLVAPARAQSMKPLSDAVLSGVRGGDGLSFDLANFSLSGDARITYTTPDHSASAYFGNFYATRSDSTIPFSDPYRMDIVSGAPGLADVIKVSFPVNADASQKWQFAYDWGVSTDLNTLNPINVDAGSVIYTDAVFSGGGLQWSTPRIGDGVAFGVALRLDIGNVAFQAQRSISTEQMNLTGVHIGAVDGNGTFLNAPWVIADVASQPGVLNLVKEPDGTPRLHIGIGWPDANYGSGAAPLGGLVIDNLSFRSNATGNLDLGKISIGTMQIQYLDIKFKP